jgi:hypothetical protein
MTKARKRNKSDTNKKEVKLSLFPDDIILHLKDPKDSAKITLRSSKHFQQSIRIQNKHTKINIIFRYEQQIY